MPTCLIEFLTSKPGEEEKAKQQQLQEELKGINDYLQEHGPFFGGQDITTHDLTLAPKLKHTMIACKLIKAGSTRMQASCAFFSSSVGLNLCYLDLMQCLSATPAAGSYCCLHSLLTGSTMPWVRCCRGGASAITSAPCHQGIVL